MGIRVTSSKTKSFSRDESGALLVFFGLCCAALFLVAALSFDVGRRASTQTEMQSFVDNVALSAAGELNGFPGAIDRAKSAANTLISDAAIFGEGNTVLATSADYDIEFYVVLPDDDKTQFPAYSPSTNTGPLPQDDPDSDYLARYVRITMNKDGDNDGKSIRVPWVFARVLSVFSDADLPDDRVEAEATAGFTGLACDIAPVFICMPPNPSGGAPTWTPDDNIGQVIKLIAEQGNAGGQGKGNSGNGGQWAPGNFAYLNVRDQIPDEVLNDPDGSCSEYTSVPDIYACLVAGIEPAALCFENGFLSTYTGGANGLRPTTLNSFIDMFDSAQGNLEGDPNFPPGPVVTKDYVQGTTCAPGSSATTTTTTTNLPPDDCFLASNPGSAGCQVYNGEPRYGNKDWSDGRLKYVDTNYSQDHTTLGVDPVDYDPTTGTGEIVTVSTPPAVAGEYHIDDPFRPKSADVGEAEDGTAAVSGNSVVPASANRYRYYQAEVARSYYVNPSAVYDGVTDTYDAAASNLRPSPEDLIKDIFVDNDGDGIKETLVHDRLGSSLPTCSRDGSGDLIYSTNPKRRTILVAAVDCDYWKAQGELNGQSGQFRATYFFDMFLLNPSRPNGTTVEIYGEVATGALNTGEDTVASGTFRNLIQLYR